MPILVGLQIAAYLTAAAVGLANCAAFQDWQAQQEQEPPAIVETAEDAPELEEVAEDG